MEVYVWGNDSMLKNVYRFYDASYTCSGFEMANL